MSTEYDVQARYTVDEAVDMLRSFAVVDLSQTLEEGIPFHQEHSRYFHMLWESYYHGDMAVDYQIIMNEHSGTHVDATAHFMRDGHPQHIWIDEVDPSRIVGRAAVINVESAVRNGEYGVDVVAEFEQSNGTIREGDIMLFHTGWSRKWGVRPDNKEYTKGYPGPNHDLIGWMKERNLRAIGSDTLAFDTEPPGQYHSHWELLAEGVHIVENLKNLELLPPFVLFVALPLKIKGGSASPIRAVAYVPRGH